MIRIILPTRFVPVINTFYVDSYDRYLERLRRGELWADEKTMRYTRRMYLANIRKVLSVNGKNLEKIANNNNQISTYAPWSALGYHSFCYEHWYFAYTNPFVVPNGKTYIEIVDLLYEGEYHNDTMDEPVYLESTNKKNIILNESQLRYLIREAIKKALISA